MGKINWIDHLFNFLAVIIGVSLAFYINTVSEERKKKDELELIIRTLIEELNTDIKVYTTGSLDYNKRQLENIEGVLLLLEQNRTDSLGHKLENCMGFSNYSPRKVTFNSASASGKLELIEDFELKKKIALYHEVWVAEAAFRGDNQIKFYDEHLLPWVLSNSDFSSTSLSLNPNSRVQLSNILTMYKSLINSKMNQYKKVMKEAKSLSLDLEELIQ